jgi:DNA/RNA-binding domain of Phe-tRNA-synthetase-like protein
MAEQQRNPNLMNPALMKQSQSTSGISENVQLMSEILKKVNNAKDKPKKIAVLRENESAPLKQVLKGAFDPNIVWDLPPGDPPFMANEAPIGTEHGLLRNEAKRLWHFVKGADAATTKTQKETMFIQMLEGLHQDEAKVLLGMKNKSLNKMYKGLTESVVREAFGWNDKFVKPEPEQK